VTKLKVNVNNAVVECQIPVSLPHCNAVDGSQSCEQSNDVREAISNAAAVALARSATSSALLAASPSAAPPSAASIGSAVLRNLASTSRFVGTDVLSQLRCAEMYDLFHMADTFSCNVWQFTLPRPRPNAAQDTMQAAAMVIEAAPAGIELVSSQQ
jgi:hypothetical protein